jgi:hypothetical protein
MLFNKKLKTKCGSRPEYKSLLIKNPKKEEKTKCGIFSSIKTSIEGVKIIDIDAIARRIVSAYASISLPLTRRAFPQLLAQNLVGVQAMSGPVGLSYALRYVYGDEFERFNELV